ncbi:tetratricopeptide repeat protein [Novipirellula sp. SH528]|uniref:tetratricopeptide repeat protein n=1 Tax=Novipirellula sp. SH528 TaxID=3454466 RepID=UPI003FA0093B
MMRRSDVAFFLLSFASLMVCGGCDRLDSKPVQPPLEAMNEAAQQGHWDDAWQYSDAVLQQHQHDPDVLAQLAWVAFESEHPSESADLLMAACRAESFEREERVQQAFVATIHAGRLFDGLAFLTDAVEAQPEQFGTRRLIYDLLIGMENRTLAEPHGRQLVRKRKFDSELLASLCNTRRNASNDTSWEAVVARNPDDRRPLIPQAMVALDKGLPGDAIELLEGILDTHPDTVQAQILLGEALISAGQFESLEGWMDRLQGDYVNEPGYWVTLGKWASYRQDHAAAARAFWEATQRDSYAMDAWTGLSAELSQLALAEIQVTPVVMTAIEHRIELLKRLRQTKQRFIKSRSISRALANEIASTLVDLGRLWEAEAWLATAATLPEDPNVDVVTARQEVVSRLSRETPWQMQLGHPEMQLDLSHLPLPAMVTR